jgi:NADPH:quinone reductase-like Zn-dependent oxidoreductase
MQLPPHMKVVRITEAGGPEVLSLQDEPRPEPQTGEVLVRVAAAGVNRPDIQQRRGLYPPPPGASEIPGLDIAGVVEKAAPDVAWPRVGDAVCALVTGGGYAEYCRVPALQCMPIPRGYDFVRAAALPEVLFTSWNNVILLARLSEGESILVQGGTSGVGMATIQIAKLLRRARILQLPDRNRNDRSVVTSARKSPSITGRTGCSRCARRRTMEVSTSSSMRRPAPIPIVNCSFLLLTAVWC